MDVIPTSMAGRATTRRSAIEDMRRICGTLNARPITLATIKSQGTLESSKLSQIFEHDENEGGSPEAGAALRDIMEQVFIVLFGSYSTGAIKWSESVSQTNMEALVAEQFDDRELCTIYMSIAEAAFKKVDYAWPLRPDRQVPFGAHAGLNVTSPLGGESHYDKMLWSLTELEDRYVFQKASLLLHTSKTGFSRVFTAPERKGSLKFAIALQLPSAEKNPRAGERYWASWEVMKEGRGEHPVPYFRNSRIGPYENWSVVNRLGFKIIWKQDDKWYARYLQMTKTVTFALSRQRGTHLVRLRYCTLCVLHEVIVAQPPIIRPGLRHCKCDGGQDRQNPADGEGCHYDKTAASSFRPEVSTLILFQHQNTADHYFPVCRV